MKVWCGKERHQLNQGCGWNLVIVALLWGERRVCRRWLREHAESMSFHARFLRFAEILGSFTLKIQLTGSWKRK